MATKIEFTFPHLPKRWNDKKNLNGIAGYSGPYDDTVIKVVVN
jgi:hypothetical protein